MREFTSVAYGGWEHCFRLTNGLVELVLTGDVGIRVIRFGFVGQDNEFHENPAHLGKVGGAEWRSYGGHRLWHAPEAQPRTYYPDNQPVQVNQHEEFVRVVQAVEPLTGIQKEIDLYLDEQTAHVTVIHRLTNTTLWDVTCAPWALSVMAPGGQAIVPHPPRGKHPDDLLPTHTLTLWAYTNMRDARWTWGERYILLSQDSHAEKPQKFGLAVHDGWSAYQRQGHLFVKCFAPYTPNAPYPDLGANVEVFTNQSMLELETLGTLVTIPPQGSIEYREDWFLFADVPTVHDDTSVEEHILPRVQAAKTQL